MSVEPYEETASTSADESSPPTDEGAGTSTGSVVRVVRPGRLIAGILLSAALTTGPAIAEIDLIRRRRQEATAESSTALTEVDPDILREIRDLFDRGAMEFFRDGVHSSFSRHLLALLVQHRREGFRAIAEYLFSGNARPEVTAEALRWLADFNDASTAAHRWAILQRTLEDRSPQVRDGAILGFAAVDDPRAMPLLMKARDLEQIAELRTLIDQVLAQLDRAR